MIRSKALLLVVLTSLTSAPTAALAQARVGVGVETSLNTAAGNAGAILFVYDASQWRIDGLFGLGAANNGVALSVGGRFHYVVHASQSADFAVGAGAFINHASGRAGRGDTTGEIDIQAQIRAFLTPSVALMGSLGMGLGFGDGDVTVALAGKLSGAFGLVYFF